MIIKKYRKFLESIEVNPYWNLDDEEIKDTFVYLEDAGVDIHLNKIIIPYNNEKNEVEYLSQDYLYYLTFDEITPDELYENWFVTGYAISLYYDDIEDITEEYFTMLERLESIDSNYKIAIYTNRGVTDDEEIGEFISSVKNGFNYDNDNLTIFNILIFMTNKIPVSNNDLKIMFSDEKID